MQRYQIFLLLLIMKEKYNLQTTWLDLNTSTCTIHKLSCLYTTFASNFVVRGFVTGSTDTSLWTVYNNGVRNYCGNALPDGALSNQCIALFSNQNFKSDGLLILQAWQKAKSFLQIYSHQQLRRQIMTFLLAQMRFGLSLISFVT